MSGLWISGRVVLTTGNRADAPSPDRMVTDHHDLEDIMFRTTLSRNIPANESAAITTMETYRQALKSYSEKCPQQGYPATLVPLGPGKGDCKQANLTDARLAVAARAWTFPVSTRTVSWRVPSAYMQLAPKTGPLA